MIVPDRPRLSTVAALLTDRGDSVERILPPRLPITYKFAVIYCPSNTMHGIGHI